MLKNDGHNGRDRQVAEATVGSGERTMGAAMLFLAGFNEVAHDSGYGKVQIKDTYRREVKTRECIYGREYAEGGTYGNALHKEGVAHGGDLHMGRARGPHRGGVETKGGAQRWKIIIKGRGGCNTKRGIHGRYRRRGRHGEWNTNGEAYTRRWVYTEERKSDGTMAEEER